MSEKIPTVGCALWLPGTGRGLALGKGVGAAERVGVGLATDTAHTRQSSPRPHMGPWAGQAAGGCRSTPKGRLQPCRDGCGVRRREGGREGARGGSNSTRLLPGDSTKKRRPPWTPAVVTESPDW